MFKIKELATDLSSKPMLFDELDVAHQWHVEIIIISTGNCFETWEKLYPSYIYQSEREKMKWLQDCWKY